MPEPDVLEESADVGAVASAELVVDCALQSVELFTPPPSNAVPDDVLAHVTMGLVPGMLSSVAPSGMVPGSVDEVPEEIVPSGDVAPMPGVVVVCAWADVNAARVMADKTRRADRILPCTRCNG
jgi:hypothetical protein